MNELVVHHRYTLGSTFDVSGRNNHGEPLAVVAGTAPFAHALRFAAPESRVTVAPSPSLQQPLAVAAFVRFFLDDSSPVRRYNLVEGHLSFALYVEPGGSLTGTVLAPSGQWSGASSAPGIVASHRWHDAWLLHDGISILELQLDGQTVASSFAAPGPVNSVGPFGIAIGNWPDAGIYPFTGYLSEVKVYRYDPEREVRSLLDPCCFDGAAFDRAVRQLRDAGKFETLQRSPRELLRMLMRLTALLRGPNVRDAQRIIQWSQVAYGAFRRGDAAELARFQELFQEEVLQSRSREEIQALQEEFARIFQESGLSVELLRALAEAACFTVPTPRDDQQ